MYIHMYISIYLSMYIYINISLSLYIYIYITTYSFICRRVNESHSSRHSSKSIPNDNLNPHSPISIRNKDNSANSVETTDANDLFFKEFTSEGADMDFKSCDNDMYNNNGHNHYDKKDNDSHIYSDHDNNNDINISNDKDDMNNHTEMKLSIGCSELWLVCLKTLVNLTHNCRLASDILLTNPHPILNPKTNANSLDILSTNEILKTCNPNPTSKKRPIQKTNLNPNASINTNINTNPNANANIKANTKLNPNLMGVNLMEFCCSALSIFISWRNDGQFIEKKQGGGIDQSGGTRLYICTYIIDSMYMYTQIDVYDCIYDI
jgi:hypothetical protein